MIGALNTKVWQNLCRAMGREDLADDPRYISNDMRVKHREEVIAIVEQWLKSMPSAAEAQKVLDACGVPCSKVYTETDMEEDPHIRENGWLTELPAPENVSSMETYLGFWGLADFSEGEIRKEAAHDLGADTEVFLRKYRG